jgi:hypothetical protein
MRIIVPQGAVSRTRGRRRGTPPPAVRAAHQVGGGVERHEAILPGGRVYNSCMIEQDLQDHAQLA